MRPLRAMAVGYGLLTACGGGPRDVPEGELAVVGNETIGPADLLELRTQLGGYARRRFAGSEGLRVLLEAVIDAELLERQAQAAGLADDPRVQWAVTEERASLYLDAELQRRVPYASVAEDEQALRRYYDEHREDVRRPERRSAEGVVFPTFARAEQALGELRAGEVKLHELGEVVSTPLQARDDQQYPGFHPVLFQSALEPGEWLPEVVLVGPGVLAGRVKDIEPSTFRPMDDPTVRQELIEAVRKPRLEAAKRDLLRELAARYPVEAE